MEYVNSVQRNSQCFLFLPKKQNKLIPKKTPKFLIFSFKGRVWKLHIYHASKVFCFVLFLIKEIQRLGSLDCLDIFFTGETAPKSLEFINNITNLNFWLFTRLSPRFFCILKLCGKKFYPKHEEAKNMAKCKYSKTIITQEHLEEARDMLFYILTRKKKFNLK